MIDEATQQLAAWLESQRFRGWEPHDALRSPLLKRLSFGSRRLGIVWLQLVRRSPVNLRPLLGVPKDYNAKGMGLLLAAYTRMYLAAPDAKRLRNVEFFADWLESNAATGYSGPCWGYNFDWPNRGFFAPAGTPTVVNTAFVASAFLDLAQLAARQQSLLVARSACDFILNDVARWDGPQGLCFNYTPLDGRRVHNANLLAAAILARVGSATGEPQLLDLARRAAAFSVSHQRRDGSWPYGVDNSDGWIDNFHTAFVLLALDDVIKHADMPCWIPALEGGYQYWKERFFLSDGAPKYYPDKLHPIDVHSVAQGALTFLRFRDRDTEANGWAERVLLWSVRNMYDRSGYFHYQIQRFYRNRIPYIRWSQAWMMRALAEWQWVRAGEPTLSVASTRKTADVTH